MMDWCSVVLLGPGDGFGALCFCFFGCLLLVLWFICGLRFQACLGHYPWVEDLKYAEWLGITLVT